MAEGTNKGVGSGGSPDFTTTHWSVVLAAGVGNSARGEAALEQLCKAYWYPLYAHVRRRGYGVEDAQDLTQEFFARILEKKSIANADQEKGRFRSFLLGALKHFLADAKDRAQTLKRGGGQIIIPLDPLQAEKKLREEPAVQLSPDILFDRQWALAVLERATAVLREEYRTAGNSAVFEQLKFYLTAEKADTSYAEVAARLDLSESAVKSAIYRLRQRYYARVREEVAQTVSDSEELEGELRHLMCVFSDG
jgi:RNA polymerase sigma-70 factor (ECF subfamily)